MNFIKKRKEKTKTAIMSTMAVVTLASAIACNQSNDRSANASHTLSKSGSDDSERNSDLGAFQVCQFKTKIIHPPRYIGRLGGEVSNRDNFGSGLIVEIIDVKDSSTCTKARIGEIHFISIEKMDDILDWMPGKELDLKWVNDWTPDDEGLRWRQTWHLDSSDKK